MTDFDPMDWRTYERIVAAFEADSRVGDVVSITPNASIIGAISGVSRQVDILIDLRWHNDVTKRVIVDAKRRRAKLDINDIETFEGMMRDCRATRGILVSPMGWTDGAAKRAQEAITLKLLSLEELDGSWRASFDECTGECAHGRRRSKPGMVLWDGQLGLEVGSGWVIAVTGKCDVCHN